MSEKPILCSAQEVRAILAGRKSQARRVVTVPWWRGQRALPSQCAGYEDVDGELYVGDEYGDWCPYQDVAAPYGRPGDRLWVRETFAGQHQVESDEELPHADGRPSRYAEHFGWEQCHYRATDPTPELAYEDHHGPHCRWRPSIHMPRWASRITLLVTSVRVERLQAITRGGAVAEGMRDDVIDALSEFQILWDGLNGKHQGRAWADNPWVWVIGFDADMEVR